MNLIPFTPTMVTELVPGVAMISKKNPSARWKIVKPTVPQIIRGTVAKDKNGHPAGLVYYKPLDWDCGDDHDWVLFAEDMKGFNDIADFYKIEL